MWAVFQSSIIWGAIVIAAQNGGRRCMRRTRASKYRLIEGEKSLYAGAGPYGNMRIMPCRQWKAGGLSLQARKRP